MKLQILLIGGRGRGGGLGGVITIVRSCRLGKKRVCLPGGGGGVLGSLRPDQIVD